jgi:hypothetical protein
METRPTPYGAWLLCLVAFGLYVGVFLVLTPLLTALYAMWARLPYLHERFPTKETSIAAWGAIFVLSVAPSVLAYYY